LTEVLIHRGFPIPTSGSGWGATSRRLLGDVLG